MPVAVQERVLAIVDVLLQLVVGRSGLVGPLRGVWSTAGGSGEVVAEREHQCLLPRTANCHPPEGRAQPSLEHGPATQFRSMLTLGVTVKIQLHHPALVSLLRASPVPNDKRFAANQAGRLAGSLTDPTLRTWFFPIDPID